MTIKFWKWFIIVGILVVLYSSLVGPNKLSKIYALRKQREQLKEDILTLKQKNELLREEINELQSNPDVICRIAREQLGLVKPGELVYRYYQIPNIKEKK